MAKFKIGIECESIEGKNPTFGVGKMIFKLLEAISRRPELEKEYRFVLYFKDRVPDFEFLKAPIFEKKTVPVPFFPNHLFPIYYFVLLPLRLWFNRPDIMFWPNYMLPIIAPGKSLVMLTEDVYYEAHEGKLPFQYRLAYKIFSRWAAKFATKIMAISETSKKNLIKLYGIKPNRVFVNYLGIDTQQLETWNLKPGTFPYILFVGQMFPRRHAKEAIFAFKKLAHKFPGLKFILVGADKYPKPIISELAGEVNKQLGRDAVIYKNYVKDSELAELYAGAKALVYVSDREAFGLPPMEALSFGVPPIVMDNELGHELFGEYAFYSKTGSADDIEEAIKQALSAENPSARLRARIKTEGPEFVKKYNWNNFKDRFLEIIINK